MWVAVIASLDVDCWVAKLLSGPRVPGSPSGLLEMKAESLPLAWNVFLIQAICKFGI